MRLLASFLFVFLPVWLWANGLTIEAQGDRAAEKKQWETAAHFFRKAVIADPANGNLHYKLGGSLAMVASENRWKAPFLLSEIRSEFETVLSLQPKHIEAHWALVEYYIQVPGILGGSLEKASGYARKLEQLSAVDGLLARARIIEYSDGMASAEKLYVSAWKTFRSPTARKKLSAFYRKTKQTDKESALSSQPQ